MGKKYQTGLLFTGDATGAVHAIDEVNARLASYDRNTQRAARAGDRLSANQAATARAIRGLSRQFGAGASAIKGYLAALAGVATISAARAYGQQAQQLEALSGSLNLNISTLHAWQLAGKSTGLSAEKIGDIFKDLSDKLGDFSATGGGEARDVIQRLGLDINELIQLSPDRQLLAIADALGTVSSQSEKVFLLESLADEASRLLPLLDDNAAGLRRMTSEIDSLGLAINEADADRLTALAAEMARTGQFVDALGRAVAAEFLPAMRATNDAIAGLLGESGDATTAARDLLDTLGTAATALSAVIAGRLTAALIAYARAQITATTQSLAAAAAARAKAVADQASAAQALAAERANFAMARAMDQATGGMARQAVASRQLQQANANYAKSTAAVAATSRASGRAVGALAGIFGGIPGLLATAAFAAGAWALSNDEASASVDRHTHSLEDQTKAISELAGAQLEEHINLLEQRSAQLAAEKSIAEQRAESLQTLPARLGTAIPRGASTLNAQQRIAIQRQETAARADAERITEALAQAEEKLRAARARQQQLSQTPDLGSNNLRQQLAAAESAVKNFRAEQTRLNSLLSAGLIGRGQYAKQLDIARKSLRSVAGAAKLLASQTKKTTTATTRHTGALTKEATAADKLAKAEQAKATALADSIRRDRETLVSLRRKNDLLKQGRESQAEYNLATLEAALASKDFQTATYAEIDALEQRIEIARQIVAEDKRATNIQAHKDAAKELENLYADAAKNIRGAFTDAFRNILDGGSSSFADLGKNLLDALKGTLAELASASISESVIAPLVKQIGGALGANGGLLDGILGQLGGRTSAGGASSAGLGGSTGDIVGAIGAALAGSAGGIGAAVASGIMGVVPTLLVSLADSLFGDQDLPPGIILSPVRDANAPGFQPGDIQPGLSADQRGFTAFSAFGGINIRSDDAEDQATAIAQQFSDTLLAIAASDNAIASTLSAEVNQRIRDIVNTGLGEVNRDFGDGLSGFLRDRAEAIASEAGGVMQRLVDGLGASIEDAADFAGLAQLTVIGDRISAFIDNIITAGDGRSLQDYALLGTQLLAVNNSLSRVNQSAFALTLAGADSAQQLIDTAGGLDQLTQQTDAYYQAFFTDTERFQQTQEALRQQFQSLDIIMPRTRQGFRNLIESLDLTTSTGQQTYASLIQLSSGLSGYYTQIQQITDAITGSLQTTRDNIRLDGLDQQGKFNDTKTRADELVAQLAGLSDFTEIRSTVDEINQLINSAYNLLDDTQQTRVREEFLTYIDDVSSLAEERLNASLETNTRTAEDTAMAVSGAVRDATQELVTRLAAAGGNIATATAGLSDAARQILFAAQAEKTVRVEIDYPPLPEVG